MKRERERDDDERMRKSSGAVEQLGKGVKKGAGGKTSTLQKRKSCTSLALTPRIGAYISRPEKIVGKEVRTRSTLQLDARREKI